METMRTLRRPWMNSGLLAILLGLSLAGGSQVTSGATAAGPASGGLARAGVIGPTRGVTLPVGLKAALRQALGPQALLEQPGATSPATAWTREAELTTSDSGSYNFGSSVALSGNTSLVGASGTNGNTGAVYVFVRSG